MLVRISRLALLLVVVLAVSGCSLRANPDAGNLPSEQLPSTDLYPIEQSSATAALPPPQDARFSSAVSAVPPEVLARSTWSPDCPVAAEDLRYVTVAFWGLDGQAQTGELLLHHTVADDVVEVFAALHDARFPLQELRITTVQERDAAPTGDGNVSGAFNCRATHGSTRWSEHAKGLAIDLNPFFNPYVKGELVLPELALAYVDRSNVRPGMIAPGDVVVRAFAAIGWQWGGNWSSAKDYMHFSPTGR